MKVHTKKFNFNRFYREILFNASEHEAAGRHYTVPSEATTKKYFNHAQKSKHAVFFTSRLQSASYIFLTCREVPCITGQYIKKMAVPL